MSPHRRPVGGWNRVRAWTPERRADSSGSDPMTCGIRPWTDLGADPVCAAGRCYAVGVPVLRMFRSVGATSGFQVATAQMTTTSRAMISSDHAG